MVENQMFFSRAKFSQLSFQFGNDLNDVCLEKIRSKVNTLVKTGGFQCLNSNIVLPPKGEIQYIYSHEIIKES